MEILINTGIALPTQVISSYSTSFSKIAASVEENRDKYIWGMTLLITFKDPL